MLTADVVVKAPIAGVARAWGGVRHGAQRASEQRPWAAAALAFEELRLRATRSSVVGPGE